MADNKVEAFLKGLLTLEITTVVVDEIPPDVMISMRDQLTLMGQRMRETEDAAPTPGRARDATSVSNEGAAEAARSAKKDTKPATTEPASLKELFGAIAKEAQAKAREKADMATGRTGQESTTRLTEQQIQAAREEAAKQDRRSERARVLHDLLPPTDAELETLSGEQHATLRRMLALGDHPIALHTTISVSGDVTNLCARRYAGPSGEAIRALHAEGVSHAIGWWKSLAEGVAGFLQALLQAIAGARPPSLGRGGDPGG